MKRMRLWRVPISENIPRCENICAQVRDEVPDPEVEVKHFLSYSQVIILAIYPETPKLDFSVGGRLEQLVLEAGGQEIPPELVYQLLLEHQNFRKIDPGVILEVIFEPEMTPYPKGH